jgi:hypothetical protein
MHNGLKTVPSHSKVITLLLHEAEARHKPAQVQVSDHNGPLFLQNLMAFAMGIDPMHPPTTAMPMIVEHDSNNFTVTLRYRRGLP